MINEEDAGIEVAEGEDGVDKTDRPPPSVFVRGFLQISLVLMFAGIIAAMMGLNLELKEYEQITLGIIIKTLLDLLIKAFNFQFGSGNGKG